MIGTKLTQSQKMDNARKQLEFQISDYNWGNLTGSRASNAWYLVDSVKNMIDQGYDYSSTLNVVFNNFIKCESIDPKEVIMTVNVSATLVKDHKMKVPDSFDDHFSYVAFAESFVKSIKENYNIRT